MLWIGIKISRVPYRSINGFMVVFGVQLCIHRLAEGVV